MKGHPRQFEKEHEARILRHLERLQCMNALLQTHEQLEYENQDREYIRELKARRQKIRAQLRVMGVDLLAEITH